MIELTASVGREQLGQFPEHGTPSLSLIFCVGDTGNGCATERNQQVGLNSVSIIQETNRLQLTSLIISRLCEK